MNPSTIVTWENRQTRLSPVLLLVASACGIFVGADK
jgi:hypothetical protein